MPETNIFMFVSLFFFITVFILAILFNNQQKEQYEQLIIIVQQQKEINQLSLIIARQSENSKTIKNSNTTLQTIKTNSKKWPTRL